MGIVVAAATDASQDATVLVVLAGWLAAAVALAWFLGVFRIREFHAAPRIPRDAPVWPLASVAVGAVLGWMVVAPTLYLILRNASGRPVPTTRPDIPPEDLIALGIIGPIVGMLVALIGDAGVRPRVGQILGYGVTRLPRGVALGLLGALIAIPVVVWAAQIAEVIYQAIGLQHPAEHDLLRVMREMPSRTARIGAIAAAVVVAPVWEELLFRGHIQTLFAVGLARLRTTAPPRGFPVDPSQTTIPVVENPTTPRALLSTWPAILFTSILFALVHPAWTWPAIFVLAVCLGYAYERTNNLWVPIVMHAAFNGLSTWYYLASTAGS